jgi:hypothetical protein
LYIAQENIKEFAFGDFNLYLAQENINTTRKKGFSGRSIVAVEY